MTIRRIRFICLAFIVVFLLLIMFPLGLADRESRKNYQIYAMDFSLPESYKVLKQEGYSILFENFTVTLRAGSEIGIPSSFYESQGGKEIRDVNISIWTSSKNGGVKIFNDRDDFYGACYYDDCQSCYEALFVHYPYVLQAIFSADNKYEAYNVSAEIFNSLNWNEEAAKKQPVFTFDEYRITLPIGWDPYELDDDHISFNIDKDMICSVRRYRTFDDLKEDVLDYGYQCAFIINAISNTDANYSYNGLYSCIESYKDQGYVYVYFMHGYNLEQVYFTYTDEERTNRAIETFMNNVTCIKPYMDSKVYQPGYFVYDVPDLLELITPSEDHILSLRDSNLTFINIGEQEFSSEEIAFSALYNTAKERGKENDISTINGIYSFSFWFPSEDDKQLLVVALCYGSQTASFYIAGDDSIPSVDSVCEFYGDRLLHGTYVPHSKPADVTVEQKDFSIGSVVEYGRYEQDNNTENGAEPIEWIVIGQTDGNVNLISKYILDLQRYNIEKVDITWASSNLRKWLNNDFLNKAFSSEEKKNMIPWEYKDTDDVKLSDYVYCLSLSDVESLWPSQNDRVAKVTDYVFALDDYTNTTREGQWWLRSESVYNGLFRTAQDVYSSGIIGVDNFRSMTIGARPCICVSKLAIQSADITSTQKQTKESKVIKIGVTDKTVDKYFDVLLEGVSFIGKKLTLKYTVSPLSDTYTKHEQSSSEITINFSIDVYGSKTATKPVQHKDYSVVLKKGEGYSRSGNIDILLPSDSVETAYWDYSIVSCSGSIYIEIE